MRGKDNPQSKAVRQLTRTGKLIEVFDSLSDAKRAGYNLSAISACCHGRLKTHLGCRWEFVVPLAEQKKIQKLKELKEAEEMERNKNKVKLTPAQGEAVSKIQADETQAVYHRDSYLHGTCHLAGSNASLPSQTVAALIRKQVLILKTPAKDHWSADLFKLNPLIDLEFIERETKVFDPAYIYEATVNGIIIYKVVSEGAIRYKMLKVKEDMKTPVHTGTYQFDKEHLNYEAGRYFSDRKRAERLRVEMCHGAVAKALKDMDLAKSYLHDALGAE